MNNANCGQNEHQPHEWNVFRQSHAIKSASKWHSSRPTAPNTLCCTQQQKINRNHQELNTSRWFFGYSFTRKNMSSCLLLNQQSPQMLSSSLTNVLIVWLALGHQTAIHKYTHTHIHWSPPHEWRTGHAVWSSIRNEPRLSQKFTLFFKHHFLEKQLPSSGHLVSPSLPPPPQGWHKHRDKV